MWLSTGIAYLTHQYPAFWVALAALFGAVAGSFLNCALYRLPRGLSLRHPAHSFCPACRERLQVIDLIPILSWLALRGRCRRCGAAIGIASLLVELAATATFAALAALLIY